MLEKKEYVIEIEMSDNGKLFNASQAGDFIVQHLVRKEEAKTKEMLSGLLCPIHHNFPKVKSTINDDDLIVIQVITCCMPFNDIVDERFQKKMKPQ
jgi:hypothetical protein